MAIPASQQGQTNSPREISDWRYDSVLVRQNIPALVADTYKLSLAWSIATSSSTTSQCTLEVSVNSQGLSAASAGISPGGHGSWSTLTGTYTAAASTGVPLVISISCSEGGGWEGNPIIGLADISFTNECVSATTSSLAATSTGSSVALSTDALSTAATATTSIASGSSSSSASSTTTSGLTVSTGTAETNADGTTTVTADSTSGTSLEASESVDSSDSGSVSGTWSVSSDTASTERKGSAAVSLTVTETSTAAPVSISTHLAIGAYTTTETAVAYITTSPVATGMVSETQSTGASLSENEIHATATRYDTTTLTPSAGEASHETISVYTSVVPVETTITLSSVSSGSSDKTKPMHTTPSSVTTTVQTPGSTNNYLSTPASIPSSQSESTTPEITGKHPIAGTKDSSISFNSENPEDIFPAEVISAASTPVATIKSTSLIPVKSSAVSSPLISPLHN
ncbi:uncharacterized protein BO80DRAFT_434899 [Aspergillus ibericus CBS 121593]|uniref:Uncharacterized protein n=1 Tax=Aspergillus ibericus CBS 121593 TaxID=1448316 RepID=A0A395GZL9_9EURO|nr:hypothetical protein BO80DRAFT_434899 [Aspergillus ibericus CBS 121593]RAL00810.1 hypothetical protein BO80DRAFT_434899 [Aspergillus ibericus CBS 121593]